MRIGYRQDKLLSEEDLIKIEKSGYFSSISKTITNPQNFSKNDIKTLENMYIVGVDSNYLSKQVYKYTKTIKANDVIISNNLAKEKSKKMGEYINIQLDNGSSIRKKIIEILPNSVDPNTPYIVLIDLNSIKSALNINKAANLLYVKLNERMNKSDAINFLHQEIDKNLVIDEFSEFEEVKKNYANLKQLTLILGTIIIVLAGILFLNNLQVVSKIREKEIAILRMVGTTRKNVFHLVLIENLIVCGMGIFLGLLIFIIFVIIGSALMEVFYDLEVVIDSALIIKLLLICICCYFILMVISIGSVIASLKITPKKAFTESFYSEIRLPKRNLVIWELLFVVSLLSFILSIMFKLKYLVVFSSLIMAVSFLALTPYTVSMVTNFLKPIILKLVGKEAFITLKIFIMERKKNSKVIQLIALSISLSMIIPSFLYSLQSEMIQNEKKIYTTNFIASSNKVETSTLPFVFIAK